MFAKAITTYEPEHRRILRAHAAEFVASRPLSAVRARAESRNFDRDVLGQMARLGWLGILATSEGELDACDLVALHRELGRGIAPEPVLASGVLAATIVASSQAPAARARLASLCSGEIVATLAWQGQANVAGASECGATARRTEGGWTFDGSLRFVPWAAASDAVLVAARGAEGVVIGWFSSDDPRLGIRQASGIDRSDFATLFLDGAFVADADVVCGPDEGAACLDEALDLARLAASAELVGAAEGVFQITLDYIRQRKQFGKPIGANQAVQFIATDLFVQIELANSVLASAAARFARPAPERAAVVAGCKARCGDAAFMAMKQAIQLHGAIGYTHECDVSLYVRRIMQLNAWLGSPAFHRQRIRRMRTPDRAAA